MLAECLDNIRVLDFSHVVAGPLCSMLLADMGATVTKVEPPSGELGRAIGPPWQGGESVVFLSMNRNKQGVAIDLKKPGARDIILRMAAHADVVLESFRPGVMDALGIGYASVRAVQPSMVYCSISSFGQTGPWADRPGVDGIIQAVSGLMSTIGTAEGGPCKVPVPIADMATGYLATIAILGALRARERTGQGQYLDVNLYNSTIMLQQVGMAFHLATGDLPAKTGSAAPYAAPNEALPTADGWIMVAAYQPGRWAALCRVMARPELEADPRFSTNDARIRNRIALVDTLGKTFRAKTTAQWASVLREADILCGEIADYASVVASPQYLHNKLEVASTHPTAGTVRTPGFGIASSAGMHHRNQPAPMIGQHSRDGLREYGFTEKEIDRLIGDGVVRAARYEHDAGRSTEAPVSAPPG
jgi:crotonobetainyl-CoA:carnitine CoA-transferase CaiB-like acyl-CoA transferase